MPIRIVRPDGTVIEGTPEELERLRPLGYHEEGIDEGRWRAGEVQTEKDYTTGEEQVKTVLEGGLSGATLGASDLLLNTDRAKLRAKYNEGLRTGSEIGGAILTTLVPGGEFLPAGALSKVATRAGEAVGGGLKGVMAAGAIEGAGAGFQQELASAQLTNTPFNAEAVLHGLGAGAILSAGLHGIGVGAEKLGTKLEPEKVKAPLVNSENYGKFRTSLGDIKNHVTTVDNELLSAQAELDLLKSDDAARLQIKADTVDGLKKELRQAEKNADNADTLHAAEAQVKKRLADDAQDALDTYNNEYASNLASATAQRDTDISYGGLLHSREKLDDVMDKLHKEAVTGDTLKGDSELLSGASKARKQFEKAIKDKDFLQAEEMLALYRSKLEEFAKSADIGTKTVFKDVPKMVGAPGSISKKLVPTKDLAPDYVALEKARVRAETAVKQAEKELKRKAKTVTPETQKELIESKKAFEEAKAAYKGKQFTEVEHTWDSYAQEYLNKDRVNEAGIVRPKGHVAEYVKIPDKALASELPEIKRVFRNSLDDLAADTADEYPVLAYRAKQTRMDHDRFVASGPQLYKDKVVELDAKLQQAQRDLDSFKPADLTQYVKRVDEVKQTRKIMKTMRDFPDTVQEFTGMRTAKLNKVMDAVDGVLSSNIPALKPLQDSLKNSIEELANGVGIKLEGSATDKLRAIHALSVHPTEVAKARKYSALSGFTQYNIGKGVAAATGTGMPGYFGTRMVLSNLLGAKSFIEGKLSTAAKAIGKGLKSKVTTKYVAPRLIPLYTRLTGGKDDSKLTPNQAALNRINEISSIIPQLPDLAYKGLANLGIATTHNDIATSIHQALVNGVNGILELLPRDNTGVLSGLKPTYEPDDVQTLVTAKIMDAVHDPAGVFERMGKGIIDAIQVQAVKAFAPEMFQYFRSMVIAHTDFSKLSYEDQIALSTGLDLMINSCAAPENIVDAQSQFAATPPASPMIGGKGGGQTGNKGPTGGFDMTTSQRLMQ